MQLKWWSSLRQLSQIWPQTGYKSKKSLSILQIFGYMLEHLEAIEKLFGKFFKNIYFWKKIGD